MTHDHPMRSDARYFLAYGILSSVALGLGCLFLAAFLFWLTVMFFAGSISMVDFFKTAVPSSIMMIIGLRHVL